MQDGAGTPATHERILVCVGPSPSSAPLVRAAGRMARARGAAWVAVFVDAPDAGPSRVADRERVENHLRLAESLGADVVRLSGDRVADELLRYAREHKVTRIVTGKPTHPAWRDLFRGSLVGRLARGSGGIEVHLLAGEDDRPPGVGGPAAPPRRSLRPIGFVAALLLVVVATGLSVLGRVVLSQADVVMAFLLIIMLVAFRFGRGPSLLAAGLSVAAYDFFFVLPYHTFAVEHSRHFLTFATMFGVALAISTLTARLREKEREAQLRERHTAALYALTRELAAATDEATAAGVVAHHAADVFGGEAVLLLRRSDGSLVTAGASTGATGPPAEELALAEQAAARGRPTGGGGDSPSGPATAVPLASGTGPVGVLVLRAPDVFGEGRSGLLDAFVRQAALSLERLRLAGEVEAAALRARTEELRSSLLSSVSHDLRTPLAAITGAGTALRDEAGRLAPDQRAELLDTVCSEAERMERLIGNILDAVRLQAGPVTLRREWVPVEEVVGSALARLGTRLATCEVRLDLPPDLPLAHADPVLLEQLLVNLLDNAQRHGAASGPIEVRARADGPAIVLEVADRGPGLSPGEEQRVFEKFYRGAAGRGGGVGLGLAICRGIAEAHGGAIAAANRDGGGASFRVRLPPAEAAPPAPPAEVPEQA